MPSPTEITVNQLSRLIGTAEAPIIIDVRIDEDFDLDPQILPTATRGADTNRHELAPESAGLLAASLGLSRIYRDDNEQLDAGMLLYDAFYRWARDASNEGHDSPTTNGTLQNSLQKKG